MGMFQQLRPVRQSCRWPSVPKSNEGRAQAGECRDPQTHAEGRALQYGQRKERQEINCNKSAHPEDYESDEGVADSLMVTHSGKPGHHLRQRVLGLLTCMGRTELLT
jgi:hypothetical protein